MRANTTLAAAMQPAFGHNVTASNFCIMLPVDAPMETIRSLLIASLGQTDWHAELSTADASTVKFAEFLPPELLQKLYVQRHLDREQAMHIANGPVIVRDASQSA